MNEQDTADSTTPITINGVEFLVPSDDTKEGWVSLSRAVPAHVTATGTDEFARVTFRSRSDAIRAIKALLEVI